MIMPSDQNYAFNGKVIGDLVDLCNQLQKITQDDDHKLKESLLSKSYLNEEFMLSQTSQGSEVDLVMSEKTCRLLNDYERLKFESEHLKVENIKLKDYQYHMAST